MSTESCRILVMASGNGSNFQAIIDAIGNKISGANIIRLIVNRSNAYATQRAEKAGIPWEYFNLVSHGFQAKGEKDSDKIRESRDKYDAVLAQKVIEYKPDLIILAGWMYVFGRQFLDPVDAAGIKIINLHPALPGQYDGTNAISRAFDDFQAGKIKGTGIMVHYVIAQVDRGEPILVREIECREGETLHELEDRIHSHEHELIVEAAAKVAKEVQERKQIKTQ
ncbi:formyl transferase [Podospora australis]|uniref:Phosphoribosylglycinamide formyltransferase n=1 Tax=Podospora australis TaxID=1536484 RepID=A0AAN6WT83_9PEZI|nr:formyl transferase [Podospora australis]